jgi:polyisoprenoid-binding protein YceI
MEARASIHPFRVRARKRPAQTRRLEDRMRPTVWTVLALGLAIGAAPLASRAQILPRLGRMMEPPVRPAAPIPAPKPSKDPAAAPAGTYRLDPQHVAVILRVAHAGGFSYSVFRMNTVSGYLTWDPAAPESSKLTVKIVADSIDGAVPGLADLLTSGAFLNTELYPDITFTSTSIQRTGANEGTINGNLTMHGLTRPVALQAELIGAGMGMRAPVLGFKAHTTVKRLDFGVGPVGGVVGADVAVDIDVEFDKADEAPR